MMQGVHVKLNPELSWLKQHSTGHFGKWIRIIWKVLKYGAGEEWRRSVGPICEK
jgi:hypothetical protein